MLRTSACSPTPQQYQTAQKQQGQRGGFGNGFQPQGVTAVCQIHQEITLAAQLQTTSIKS